VVLEQLHVAPSNCGTCPALHGTRSLSVTPRMMTGV
jgi:hypothetical protein